MSCVPLIEVPRLLRQHGVVKSYQQIWSHAVAGKIPATRDSGKWFVAVADIPTIAKAYAAG